MTILTDLGAPCAALLKARGQRVGVAESSAGGLISAALLSQAGASAYFQGGGVIYTQAAREGLVRLEAADMAGLRSSSEPYALLLARRTRLLLGADWGLAETGAAGPSGNRYGDAPGHTCLAVVGPAAEDAGGQGLLIERVRTLETGSAHREENMWAFTRAALDLLESVLKE